MSETRPRRSTLGAGHMRSLTALLGFVVVGLGAIAAVLTFGGASPESVVEDYLAAETEGDYLRLCELSGGDHRDELLTSQDPAFTDCDDYAEEMERRAEEATKDPGYDASLDRYLDELEPQVEILAVDEQGDEAVVEVEVTYEHSGGEPVSAGQEGDDTRRFAVLTEKIDGSWLVTAPYYQGD
ncbi:MAG: hypothetical protein QM597_05100 [Aeromicrobium sp.]|uniref:hypothetical protein n=1 Tax=Aeromicrobium sp. TaxID=1871063 RepID=UPI0039E4F3EB